MNMLRARLDSLDERFDWLALAILAAIGSVLALDLPLPVAAVLFGAAAMLSICSPAAALGGVLAATPLIFRPVSVGFSSWTLLELALIAAAVGLGGRIALELFADRTLQPLRDIVPAIPVLAGAIILVVLSAVSLTNLADEGHRDASVRAVRTVVLEPLVVIPLTLHVLKRGRIVTSLGGLAAGLILAASWGFAGLLTGSGVSADDVRRATGPYTHPNNLAFFLERATLLTAIPALLVPRYRRIGIVLLVVGCLATMSTFSRGALLGLPAGLVIALWLVNRLRAVALVGAAAVAAAGAFALLAGDRLFDRGGEGAEPSRLVIWDGAERILRDFPLTGIGPDQFFVMYGLRYIEPAGWPERYTSHPHNLFLDFWSSLGIGGLVFAIFAVVLIAGRMRAIKREQPDGVATARRVLAVAGAAALTAGIVHGMVDNSFFLPDLAVLTWFAIVLLSRSGSEDAT